MRKVSKERLAHLQNEEGSRMIPRSRPVPPPPEPKEQYTMHSAAKNAPPAVQPALAFQKTINFLSLLTRG